MSGIADIDNVPSNEREADIWSFAHMTHHLNIVSQMQTNNLGEFDLFPLDPAFDDPTGFTDNWLARHAEMHRQMDNALGINQNVLVTADWDAPGSKENWWEQHADEHYQADQILGLT